MRKHKSLVLLSLLALLAMVMPSLAAGPVYDELPDLGGREVTVAVENLYKPFQFESVATGAAEGFEYDMIAEICARLNCVPVYEVTSFSVQISQVAEGQYDLGMNGLSITDERKEVVDYSSSYINLDQYLLVRADEDRFTSLEEFAANDELVLGVQNGTSGYFVTEGVVPEDRRVIFDEFGALVAALISGDIDAMPADLSAAAGFISTTAEQVMFIGEPISKDEFGLIFPKGSDLVAPFSAAIDSMKADGFLGFLYYKWFLDLNPVTDELYEALPDLAGREVTIGVENLYSPFQFEETTTGQAMGFEYDMIAEICRRINCTPNYEVTSFSVQISQVAEGQYDLGMNGLSITDERKEVVDYSSSYINLDQYLLVRADEDRFTSLEEFAANDELILGVQNGTSGFFVTEGVVPEERRVIFDDFLPLVAALINGDIDAMPADISAAAGFISTTAEQVTFIGEPISKDEFGLIFPKGSDLVAPFSAAIDGMKADGYLAYLYYKWFFDYQVPASE
ncbi:MAG: transporter substrate-binding domain-containing protein [Anaerolineae bacterium]|nr:transporter substrate-binding domain-containing protein [Anaerolineae bacterium]